MTDGSYPDSDAQVLAMVEAERDLWTARYFRLMGWVRWFRDDICHWKPARWDKLYRAVGQAELFCASLELEAEVKGDQVTVVDFANAKDRFFREMLQAAAESESGSGRAKGQEK